ncbi:MAG: flagellar basal body P-ring protein FlgI [Planctomycetota bacterium]
MPILLLIASLLAPLQAQDSPPPRARDPQPPVGHPWGLGGVQAPQQPQAVSGAGYSTGGAALAGGSTSVGDSHPSNIRELVGVRGLEDNTIFGVGLVVGLAGTGDSIDVAKRLVQNVLLTRNVHADLQELATKNVAIVQVEGRLPAGLKPGRRIDVTVSTIGDATSLAGGTLVFSELFDPSGRFVYATASGPVNTGGFQATGQAASAKRNQTTVATLPGGGKVEREVPTSIVSDNGIVYLDLHAESSGLGNAMRIADSVNGLYPGMAAALSDGRSIEVRVPGDLPASEVVAFVHGILERQVEVEISPRVILSERTGTIVLGGDVRLRAGAIAHGSITVTIAESPVTSQPGPFSAGRTVVTPRSSVDVTEDPGRIVLIPNAVTLREVVEVLDVLGATPRELVSIIEAMAQGGLLEAEIRRM